LSVGNGQFAFTADVTGLQTFPAAFEQTIPLGTLSQWGWHSAPNPKGWSIEKYKFTEFDSHGRQVGYADIPGDRRTPEVEWLRRNPHRLHLGRLGFRLTKADGTPATASDLSDIEQTLDLWNGVLVSRFKLEGQPVEVETVCHPTLDLVAVHVVSPLVAMKRLAISCDFRRHRRDRHANWSGPDAHATTLTPDGENGAPREVDNAGIKWPPDGRRLARSAKWRASLRAGTRGAPTLNLLPIYTGASGNGLPFAATRARRRSLDNVLEQWRGD
jgi:hypothetical protein